MSKSKKVTKPPREVVPEATSAGAESAARKTPMGIEPEKPTTKAEE